MSTPTLVPRPCRRDGRREGASPARRLVAGRITRIASVLVSLGALAILLRRVDLPAALRTATAEPWPSLAAVVSLNAVATWLRVSRSQMVLNTLGHRVDRLRMVVTQLAGQTVSWVSPAAAGAFVRPYLWRSHDGVPLTPGVVTVLYERIFSFGQLLVLGAVCVAPFVLGGPALVAAAASGLPLDRALAAAPAGSPPVAEAGEIQGSRGWARPAWRTPPVSSGGWPGRPRHQGGGPMVGRPPPPLRVRLTSSLNRELGSNSLFESSS